MTTTALVFGSLFYFSALAFAGAGVPSNVQIASELGQAKVEAKESAAADRVVVTKGILVEKMKNIGYELLAEPKGDKDGGMTLVFIPKSLSGEFPPPGSDHWYYISPDGKTRKLR